MSGRGGLRWLLGLVGSTAVPGMLRAAGAEVGVVDGHALEKRTKERLIEVGCGVCRRER